MATLPYYSPMFSKGDNFGDFITLMGNKTLLKVMVQWLEWLGYGVESRHKVLSWRLLSWRLFIVIFLVNQGRPKGEGWSTRN